MASGHVNRIQKAEHMAAPTNAANVKKALANSEPSTHGTTWHSHQRSQNATGPQRKPAECPVGEIRSNTTWCNKDFDCRPPDMVVWFRWLLPNMGRTSMK